MFLDALLTAAKAGLVVANIDPPARSMVSQGPPDVALLAAGEDDRALAVYLLRVEARGSGERRLSSPGELQMPGWHTVLMCRIEYHQCVPGTTDSGGAPDVDAITTATHKLGRAAWAVWCELAARKKADTLVPAGIGGGITADNIGIGSLTPVPPSGYSAGWQLTVDATVPTRLDQ